VHWLVFVNYECVSVLLPQLCHMQIASFLLRFIWSSVACLLVTYFYALHGTNFEEKKY